MLTACIKFNSLPHIGFAHHFSTDSYSFTYNHCHKSFEVAYINSGALEAELYGKTVVVPQGSVFVLFRHLPITVRSVGAQIHSHCTVQAELDYDFSITDNNETRKNGRLYLPLVTLPCHENEIIKKHLNSIISDMGVSRDKNAFSCSLKLLETLRIIDETATKNQSENTTSIIEHKVRRYIARNLDKKPELSKIAAELELTPGYINHSFKQCTGMPIVQYFNSEKAKRIAELIKDHRLSFKSACENVGITDISYGYRLFKKHMGITPNSFLSGDFHE